MSLRNWREFKWPYEKMETFTKSEPFPSAEVKATYVGGGRRDKRPPKTARTMFSALLERKKKQQEAR